MVNRGDKNSFLDQKNAYLNDSLFLRHMLKHGVTVNRKNRTTDIILLKFEYGVKETDTYDGITSAELREEFYKNGVNVPWAIYDKDTGSIISENKVHYKMLMRSPGKAKKGECYFIKENLLKNARNYLTMNLYDKMPEENTPLVEMSAYSTLTTATAMDYINIPLDNILIVEDKEVEAETRAVIVKTHDVEYVKQIVDYNEMEKVLNKEGYTFYKKHQKQHPELELVKSKSLKSLKECGISEEDYIYKDKLVVKTECEVVRSDKDKKEKVKNVLWDGMGLIDESIFPVDKEMNGFIYCRSHFFKSCLFRGNVVQFFKDYYKEEYETAVVEDMFGNKKSIKDIRVIITDKSIKWIKFISMMGGTGEKAYKYYDQIMKKYNYEFAIVKTAHASKWGDYQRSSYQINNSLPCTDENTLRRIVQTSIDYCNNLKTDHELLMNHLEATSPSYGVEKVWVALDERNSRFKDTQYFKIRKNTLICKFKNERLMLGKLLQHGDNLTACGNPLALLKTVVKEDGWKEENCFQVSNEYIECYTSKFKERELLAGFRSPHNSPNNILCFKNVYPAEMIKYFPNLGGNVIVINGIHTDSQDRANSQDYDSDSFYVTNQSDMANLAREAYINYPTIINGIPLAEKSDNNYKKDLESYAKMDNKISSSQFGIGWSSNIAQLALSYYYDMIKNGGSEDDLKDLEDIFIICSVLAQVEIDSAKRIFDIKPNAELRRLGIKCYEKREGKKKYPKFYADNQSKLKDYKIEAKDIDENVDCPMQILYNILRDEIVDLRKIKSQNTVKYDLSVLFKPQIGKERDSKQYKKIISIVEEYDEFIKSENKTSEDYYHNVEEKFNECMKKIGKYKINNYTMSSLIKYAFANRDGNCDRMLTFLFNGSKEIFLNCFISDKK